ncbi:MAG TPA: aminoacyl-histidine dipeptidase [Bacteroidales bacterium]|jgi:dipeptidase D|nr:aminoacyl-histidine dipeptidase [Bacteroidales bacterium]
MNTKLEALAPAGIWKNFKNLTQIPRPSKKEARIIEYVKDFGEKLGLETKVDAIGNVIIRKPATPGMENRKGVIFQSHLDMVPQKNNDKKHDFEKDPIEAYIDNDWVKANGTTLGADNGIGVAAMLSVLESKDLKHGPIECLFTIDEETGMTGAFALKAGLLQGDILLNLDSEDEGELYIGCAGGMDANIEFDYLSAEMPTDHIAYEIKISGLKGGHSGLEINLGRGNSNLVLSRVLRKAELVVNLRLSEFEGGNMRNAIPREAHAIVLVPRARKNDFEKLVQVYREIIRKELSAVEPDLKIEIKETSQPSRVMDSDLQKRVIASIFTCPNGVIRMTDGIPGLVETSTNLSIIKTNSDKININCLLRSSVDTAKENLSEVIRALFELAGARSTFTGSYPGWKPNMDSSVMKLMDEVYQKMYNKKMEIKAVHAGLECGIIGGVYPNLDMVSFGPTIRHPHSPDEKVNVPSVQKFWDFLVKTLESVPVK